MVILISRVIRSIHSNALSLRCRQTYTSFTQIQGAKAVAVNRVQPKQSAPHCFCHEIATIHRQWHLSYPHHVRPIQKNNTVLLTDALIGNSFYQVPSIPNPNQVRADTV